MHVYLRCMIDLKFLFFFRERERDKIQGFTVEC